MTGIGARFDDLVSGMSWEMSDPLGVLTTDELADVPALLDAVEKEVRTGVVAAGFVSYEAAPAFDRALTVHSVSGGGPVPLAWFGLFGRRRPVDRLVPLADPLDLAWEPEIGEEEHACAVEAIKEEIASGRTYQANFTARLTGTYRGEVFSLYRRLASGQGGAYSALLESERFAIACASPELFFSMAGEAIECRPMKGTAGRGRFPAEDAAASASLRSSEKERAENLMIVDLVRNDLGKIARSGTVRASDLFACERYPTLWQLTSTVNGRLVPGTGLTEVFSALFPCGSVTGAPKPATMGIISRLERSPRGVYCGAIGMVSAGSGGLSARFAVGIRTATIDKRCGMVIYGTGGGITADSVPVCEWEELCAKANLTTGSQPPEGLFETLRFSPQEGLHDLQRHLARIQASAEFFGLEFSPSQAREVLNSATQGLHGIWRVRLVLGRDGSMRVTTEEYPEPAEHPVRLAVDEEPIDERDTAYFHKITDRSAYADRAARHPEADDVVLVNRRGEVTETSRANLAVRFDGRWWTPPVESGLLAGVERGRLLDDGVLAERVITVPDLFVAEGLATVSSLRGWLEAEMVGSNYPRSHESSHGGPGGGPDGI